MRKIVRDILLNDQLIGDLLSVRAVACYALRRLYSNYFGFCIRVRRSSDDAEQDIGFTSNGDLDTVALLTFVGANNGFVAISYDLTGNGYNAIQSSPALQVPIIIAGVLQQINLKAAMQSTVAGQYLLAATPSLPQPNYISAVVHNPSVATSYEIFLDGQTSRNALAYRSTSNTINYFGGTERNVAITNTTIPLIWGALFSGASSALQINGAQVDTGNTGNLPMRNIILFAAQGFSSAFSATTFMAEVWFFSQNIPNPTDRQLLNSNQGAYYGITVN